MKKLGIGIQSFSKLISEGFIYIDKTPLIYQLLSSAGYFFLSRPRRFGKSLLVSTLKEIFTGNRELFRETWIYDKIDWPVHPVIHIDFTQIQYREQGLEPALHYYLDQLAGDYGVELKNPAYGGKLIELIETLSSEAKVVLLIDEYDKPIIDYLTDLDQAEANRDILKNFYSGIKGLDERLRFVFVTGVSKFSKVSIFSDLNNLNDITISPPYATLLGYTETEIHEYYGDYIPLVAESQMGGEDAVWGLLKTMYNGYSWDGRHFVHNPFSVLKLLHDRVFQNFWFTTGTPTFLVEAIRDQQIEVAKLSNLAVSQSFFDKFELRRLDIYSLLFQTGYLTIKKVEDDIYYLSYPNEEVRVSFLNNLLEAFAWQPSGLVNSWMVDIHLALNAGDVESFITHLRSLFASIPYQIFIDQLEYYYHSVIYIALKLLGVRLACEVQTSKGRIDAVVETKRRVYVMEFKLGTAEEAMKQIEERDYGLAYKADGREVVKLGVGFSREDRNIGDWLVN